MVETNSPFHTLTVARVLISDEPMGEAAFHHLSCHRSSLSRVSLRPAAPLSAPAGSKQHRPTPASKAYARNTTTSWCVLPSPASGSPPLTTSRPAPSASLAAMVALPPLPLPRFRPRSEEPSAGASSFFPPWAADDGRFTVAAATPLGAEHAAKRSSIRPSGRPTASRRVPSSAAAKLPTRHGRQRRAARARETSTGSPADERLRFDRGCWKRGCRRVRISTIALRFQKDQCTPLWANTASASP